MPAEVREVEIPYGEAGGQTLWMRVYAPAGARGCPGVIDLHGGAWTHFDPSVDFYWCRGLARRGYVVASVAFRLAPEHPWPAFFADAQAAARFVRHNAASLGVDGGRLGAVGGSTGGHLAALLALAPALAGATRALATPPEAPAHVDWAAALWPILDVPGRYRLVTGAREGRLVASLADRIEPRRRAPSARGLVASLRRLDALHRRGGAADLGLTLVQRATAWAGQQALPRALLYRELARAHRGAFRDEGEMEEASPLAIVRSGRATRRPPLLVIQGERDVNTTPAMTDAFAEAYRAAGGRVEVRYPPGLGHSYGNVPSREADELIEAIDTFARRATAQAGGDERRPDAAA